MFIGSDEHKELFCRAFIDSHKPFEPPDMPWPELDELSLARLRAIPIWSMALGVELGAGSMLAGYASSEPDPLVRQALEMQGYEEARHGRILDYMNKKYALNAVPDPPKTESSRRAFVDFGYDECVDSFAGFGIFKLACDARILPESLTSMFAQVLYEEARHIMFFVNWVAWDRTRRGLPGPALQAIPSMAGYGGAIARKVKLGSSMADGDGNGRTKEENEPFNLFADVLDGLTASKFVRTCLEENDRYMQSFDPRLLRPRVIPSIARVLLPLIELVEFLLSLFQGPPKETTAPANAP